MDPLRVAFTGASGTGKSTLASWVAEQYGLPICPVGSRSVAAEMGLASPYDADRLGRRAELQGKIFLAKHEWENAQIVAGNGFVTDRAYYDNLAYSMLHCVDDVPHELLMAIVLAQKTAYTHVFFLPITAGHGTHGDPARRSGREYHLLFQAALMGLYSMDEAIGTAQCMPVRLDDQEERRGFVANALMVRP